MVTGPPAWKPIHGDIKRKGMRNEMGLVIADCGGPLVPSSGLAPPETRRSGLNEPVVLGPGQNGESQKGKPVIFLRIGT